MADDRIQIQIDATDGASPVLRQVADNVSGDMKQVAGAAEQVGDASEEGFGRATDAAQSHAQQVQGVRDEIVSVEGAAEGMADGVEGAWGSASGAAEEHAQAVAGVVPEIEQVEAATDQVADSSQGAWSRMTQAVDEHEQTIQKVSIGMAAFGAVVAGVAAANVKAFMTQEQAEMRLEAAIRATGQAIDAGALKRLAADLQRVTAYGDESTIAMQGMLITLGGNEQQVRRMTPVVLDLAAAFGMDLNTAARLLARTVLQGDNALQRYGISIDDATRESGDFALILAQVEQRVGGTAEMMAQTAAGAAQQLANDFGDLREIMGEALIPTFQAVVDAAKPVVSLMQAIAESPAGKALTMVGTAAGVAAGALGAIGLALPGVIRGWTILTGAQMQNAIAARAAAAANVQAAAAASAAGTAAAGAGVATGAGAAARGLGLGAAAKGAGTLLAGKGALGLAGPIGAAAAVVGAGAVYGLHRWQSRSEQQIAEIEGAEYTPLQRANLERWAAARAAPGLEAMSAPDIAAGPVGQVPDLSLLDDAAPILSQQVADQVADQLAHQLAPGAWAMPGASEPGYARALRGAASRSLRVAAEGVEVSEEYTTRGREVLVRILVPEASPGAMHDTVTDWMDEVQYLGFGQ